MTLAAWPSIEYRPLTGSLKIAKTVEGPISSEMNSGTTRRRRKYSLRVAPVSFVLQLSNAEAAALKTFHEVTLGDGAARFTMPIYFAGAYVTKTCAFADPPSYEHPAFNLVNVSLSLLVESI